MRSSGVSLKKMAKRLLPPVLVDWMKPVWETIRYGAPEWEYLPQGWATNDEKIKGWNDRTISETQKAKWSGFLQATKGTGPLGIAFEAATIERHDYYAHHVIMTYAYVLALAARKKTRISLLDWGGGIGHYFVFSRALIPDVDIEYSCKELPLLCEAGREVLPNTEFLEMETEVVNRRYDLVLASGALQCVEDWKSTARLLASVANPYLYVARLPFVRRKPSFVAVQRVYAYGYNTEYMCWFFNRAEFLEYMASLDLELVREFILDKHPAVKRVHERADIQGFLFRRKGG